MLRYIMKSIIFFLILSILSHLGILSESPSMSIVIIALTLGAVNTLIRPILLMLALPINLFLIGIASLFANLLSFIIANAIAGRPLSGTFWAILFTAFIIMSFDDQIIHLRYVLRKNNMNRKTNINY